MSQPEHNIGAVRLLLKDAFTAADLRRFCQDRQEFRDFVTYFKRDSSLQDAIDVVIDQSLTRGLLGNLLSEVEQHNRAAYTRYAPALLHPSPAPNSKRGTASSAQREVPTTTESVTTSQEASSPNTTALPVFENLGEVSARIRDAFWSVLPAAGRAAKQTGWDLGRGAIHQFVQSGVNSAVVATKTTTVLLDLCREKVVWEADFVPTHIAASGDGALLAMARKGYVMFVESGVPSPPHLSLTFSGKIVSMAFSPSKPRLALLYSNGKTELHDPPRWEVVKTFEAIPRSRESILQTLSISPHTRGSKAKIAFDSEQRWLASVQGGRIALYEFGNAVLTRCIGKNRRRLSCIAFSPDGATIASGDLQGHVQIHKVGNGQIVRDFVADNLGSVGVTAIAFSPDGMLLVAAVDGWAGKWEVPAERLVATQIWNLSNGKPRKPFHGHTSSINGLVFAENGNVLVSAGSDGVVRFTRLFEPELIS